MPFSAEQLDALRAPLDRSRIVTRRQAGKELSYLEGWEVIDEANAIFGFDGWSYAVSDLAEHGGLWVARVALRVSPPSGEHVAREDVGVGIPAGDSPQARETAVKAAVTDALKRALRTFGNAFGLSLYDKTAPAAPAQPPRAVDQRTGEIAEAPAPGAREGRWATLQRALSGRLPVAKHTAWTSAALKDLGYSKLIDVSEQDWAELLRRAGQAGGAQ